MNKQTRDRQDGGRARGTDLLLMALAMGLTVIAGMGEWKVLNNALGGLPKIVTLGVPCLALLCFLIRADFRHAVRCLSFLPVFLVFVLALLLWTLMVWVLHLTDPSSIVRGTSKLMYQVFTILYVVGFVYLCRERAVDCFFMAMVMVNGVIAVLEIPRYGLSESLRSVIVCILTFGGADGYVRALEIHDVTFLFGQLFVYYAALAPAANRKRKKRNLLFAGIAMVFMILGLKRTAIPAAVLWALYAVFVLHRRHPVRWMMGTFVLLIAFFWVYLYVISSGIFSRWMVALGVDMMGRDYIWGLARPYYELSPLFAGRGFEAVDAIVGQWYREGLINHAYPFHNDILKTYVELGFVGFCLWSGVQYLFYPWYWSRFHGTRAALVYVCLLGYMTVTYLTDNTAFYFWSSIGLRLVPMAYAVSMAKERPGSKWNPPEPGAFATEVWREEMEEMGRAKEKREKDAGIRQSIDLDAGAQTGGGSGEENRAFAARAVVGDGAGK